MKKVIASVTKFGPAVFSLVLPALAFAQFSAPPAGGGVQGTSNTPTTNINSLQSVLQLFCVVFGWAFYFLIILAVIFILVAAFRYLTAGGDPENVKKAGAVLLYAAVAIGVALLAKAVPMVIGTFLGAGTITSC
jgi:uncharacterized membrane protein